MSGNIPLYELLTVKQAAVLLFKSEQGVRRLVSAGKLESLREGGKLLIKPESMAAYVAGLKHPPEIMEALHTAGNLLGNMERYQAHAGGARTLESLAHHPDPFFRLCVAPQLPLCRDILAAVKVKDYAQVRELRDEMWRITTDYRMLHEPYRPPREKAKKGGKEPGPVWELPSLFPELEGGQG